MRLSSFLFCGALCVFGCRPEISEQECVPAPEAPAQPAPAQPASAVERTFLSKSGPQGGDWCQACVLSRQNFISCQKEYGRGGSDPRTDLRGVARESACTDAGYAKGECPDSALLSLVCKGETLSPELFEKAGASFKALTGTAPAPKGPVSKPEPAPKAAE